MKDRSASEPLLPVELLELIIEAILHMAGDPEIALWALSDLSLTCHLMADLCRPYMFRTFSMLHRLPGPNPLFARFYELLTSTAPHLAQYVRNVTIYQNDPQPGNALASPYLSYVLKLLPNLTHLSIMSRFSASWESLHPEVRNTVSSIVQTKIQYLKMVEITSIPDDLLRGCQQLTEVDLIGCTFAPAVVESSSPKSIATVTRMSMINAEATVLMNILGIGATVTQNASNPTNPPNRPQLTSLTAALGASFTISQLWTLIQHLSISLVQLDLRQRLRAWEVEEGHVRGPSPIDCSPVHPIGPLNIFPRLPLLTDLAITLQITNIPPHLDPLLPKPKLKDLPDHPFYDLCHVLQVVPQQLERFRLTLDFTANPDMNVRMDEVFDHPVMDWFYGKRTVLWPDIDYLLSNRQHLPHLRWFELTIVLDDPVEEYGWELDSEEHAEDLNEYADHLSALIDRRLSSTKKRMGAHWEVNILFE